MRKIILYIASSIDNFIATTDKGVAWLDKFNILEGEDYGYKNMYKHIDTLLMGSGTYLSILGMDIPWPYQGNHTYVMTRDEFLFAPQKDVTFVTSDFVEFVEDLKKQDGKDIWLVGGGVLNGILLDAGLVDEIQLCVMPITLGEGIPLFQSHKASHFWALHACRSYENGVVMITYRCTCEDVPEKQSES